MVFRFIDLYLDVLKVLGLLVEFGDRVCVKNFCLFFSMEKKIYIVIELGNV